MTCENIHLYANRYFDKNLTKNELDDFEGHSEYCKSCMRTFESYKKLSDELARISTTINPPSSILQEILSELQGNEKKEVIANNGSVNSTELNEENSDHGKVTKKGFVDLIRKKLKI